ncbi:MAG: hypothetical protein PHE26_02965 [Syntrophomonadaceae bacterium]|nr:hypothetical protein [Syntrophomonadaceae bacterium]
MGSKGKIRYVFTSSNTSQGFHTFIPDLLLDIKKIYILKGAAGTGKSTFIRLLGESLSQQGYEVEFWISALDPVNPDGLYIPQLDAAVVNGSLPKAVDPRYPGGPGEIINLGIYLDKTAIESQHDQIMELALRVEKQNNKAYNILKDAAELKEDIQKANTGNLNKEKIQQLTERVGEEILGPRQREKHYFASAVTADGMIDYIDELSVTCLKRYVFKGPPGSGIATVINELACKAGAKGHFLEFYHCGLDSENIAMLIIGDLQIALIDAGGLEISSKPWDMIIDMSTCLDDYVPDLKYVNNSEVFRNYESQVLQAQKLLECTQQALQELKKIHARSMNFALVDQKREEIRMELCKLI